MILPLHLTIALKASISASAAIMDIYSNDFHPSYKTDGSPVTVADLASSEILMAELQKTNIPIISEEVEKTSFQERQFWESVWIVDPLDGTKEFIRRNDEFVICIALVEKGESTFGIITHPVTKQILFGGPSFGCFFIDFDQIDRPENWVKVKASPTNHPLILSSSRAPFHPEENELIEFLKTKFEEIQFSKKGSALKFIDLALGKSDIYPRFAPTMEWDIAAGHAIMKSIGGEVICPETEKPLTYNKESLYNPHFIVYTPSLLQALEK